VSWSDLIALLAARAPDIARWSRDWIDEPGRPIVTVERAQTDTGGMTIILCSTDPVAGRGLAWPQPLAVDIGYEDAVEQADVWLDREIDLPVHARDGRAPNYILPNGRGLGYGEFRLDRRSLEWLLVHLPAIADPLRRGSAWLTLWDAMLAGSVTPDALVELACETLPTESDELNLQRVFSCTERLLWIFLEPAQRLRAAAGVERVMRRIVESTRIATVRSAALHAFGAIALTDASVAWLFDLWSGSPSLPALEVDEAQRVQLACELAVRRGDGDEIVRRQIGSTMHADRQAALAFIAPALSNDRRERERFFGLLCDPSNRRREPWVVDGLKWLHHPLRATLSLPLIRPGLDLLEEIQRTGDIFLPKRWLDAILGGHRSAAAAAIVDTFLDDRPQGYPPALERMVRASADHLRRVRRV
jgi:aminopeptidase N